MSLYRVYVRCQGLWEFWVLFSNYLNLSITADRVKDYQKLGHGPCSLLTIASLQDALDAETAECGLIVPGSTTKV